MILNNTDKFDIIFTVGRIVCASYTGLSKTEIFYCQQKNNWLWLQNILFAEDMYSVIILFAMSPIFNFTHCFQYFIACMIDFNTISDDEQQNIRLYNLLNIIDNENVFDKIIQNNKLIRALLAIKVKYEKNHPDRCYSIYKNSNIILAHIFKKFPNFLKLNILKTNSKIKKLRFTENEINHWFNFLNQ